MSFIQRLLFIFIFAALTSCSSAIMQNRDKQYLNARSVTPLRIPPGISSEAFHTIYPVTDRQYSDAAKEVSIVPPGL